MFVIVEWNQASGLPRICDFEVYDTEAAAQAMAADWTSDSALRGRRERYTVHALDDDPRWDSESDDNP